MKSTELVACLVMLLAIVFLACSAVDVMVTLVVTLAFVFSCAVSAIVFAWIEGVIAAWMNGEL